MKWEFRLQLLHIRLTLLGPIVSWIWYTILRLHLLLRLLRVVSSLFLRYYIYRHVHRGVDIVTLQFCTRGVDDGRLRYLFTLILTCWVLPSSLNSSKRLLIFFMLSRSPHEKKGQGDNCDSCHTCSYANTCLYAGGETGRGRQYIILDRKDDVYDR